MTDPAPSIITNSPRLGARSPLRRCWRAAFAPWLVRQRRSGYLVNLVFFISSSELARERVAARVRLGSHNISEETVKRRYAAGLHHFSGLYEPLADRWSFYDNFYDRGRRGVPELLATRVAAGEVSVRRPEPKRLEATYRGTA